MGWRGPALLAVGLLMLGLGCRAGPPVGPTPAPSPAPPPTPTPWPTPTEEEERYARRLRALGWRTDFSRRLVPLGEVRYLGLPRDGIQPIDRPVFEGVEEADRFLDPDEPVVALVWNGEARAYPLRILIWNEVVNDEVGGEPVAITY